MWIWIYECEFKWYIETNAPWYVNVAFARVVVFPFTKQKCSGKVCIGTLLSQRSNSFRMSLPVFIRCPYSNKHVTFVSFLNFSPRWSIWGQRLTYIEGLVLPWNAAFSGLWLNLNRRSETQESSKLINTTTNMSTSYTKSTQLASRKQRTTTRYIRTP